MGRIKASTMKILLIDDSSQTKHLLSDNFAAHGMTLFILESSSELKDEVVRRSVANGARKAQKCSSYSLSKLKKWLLDNPIASQEDLDFIYKEEANLRKKLEDATNERAQEEPSTPNVPATNDRGPSWNTEVAFLRLAHCLVDEEPPRLGH